MDRIGNCCAGCGYIVYNNKYEIVKVIKSGKFYCSNCKIPEGEELIFEGLLRNIFCSECGEIVPENQRKTPDINNRVFCSDEHKTEFYKRVGVCKCCGVEI